MDTYTIYGDFRIALLFCIISDITPPMADYIGRYYVKGNLLYLSTMIYEKKSHNSNIPYIPQ